MPITQAAPVIGEYKRYMVDMFDDRALIEEPTAFQSMFGRNGGKTVITDSLNIEFDTKRGNEKVAKMIKRGSSTRLLGDNFKNLDTEQFVSTNLLFGMIKEELDLTSDQTFIRAAGQNAYSDTDRQATLRMLALDGHMEQVRRMVRKDEVLASQSILLGQQEVLDGTADPDYIYDWQRNALLTAAAAAVWDGGSQDIAADIDGRCVALRKYGKVRPDVMVLGGDSLAAFIKDSDIQATADNRRYELIKVSQNFPVPAEYNYLVEGGMVPYGQFKTNKGFALWMFTYPEWYENDAGTFIPYMAEDKVLITSSKARADRYFGPSDILPIPGLKDQMFREMLGFDPNVFPMPAGIMNPGSVIVPASYHFDMYLNADHSALTIRAEHAPIFAPVQTDAYAVLTGVV